MMNDWDETKLSPPKIILQIWEQHILDNLNYTEDCFLLFGRVIGHNPDSVLNEKAILDRVNTMKIAYQARYGCSLDGDVWDFLESRERVTIDEEENHPAVIVNPPSSTPRGRLPIAGIGRDIVDVDRDPSLSPRRRPLVINTSVDEAVEQQAPLQQRSPTVMIEQSPAPSPSRVTPSQTRSVSKPSRPAISGPSENDPITIFLRDSISGEETYFSLRYRSTLRIVFTVYGERKGWSQGELNFSHNGQILTGYETPLSLGLEDRARIDVTR